MLPRRIAKAPKRSSRWRSQAHCSFVRGHECVVPGCHDRPIEVAHVRIGSGAGMGQKPDDFLTVSLCRGHHAEQHAIGEASFALRHRVDLAQLADAFAAASPRASEIRAEKAART
jgi:Protein of unknown function (DUF968).